MIETHWFFGRDVRQWDLSPGLIPVPLNTLRETTSFDVGNAAANGGLLASDTTPVLDAINAATDGCQRLLWAAGNTDQVTFQAPLPGDLDSNKNITLHARIASGGTTDAVGFTVDSFFDEGDTKVTDTSGTNQTTTTSEVTASIAAADIPSSPQTLTVGLTPVAHATDTLALTGLWLEYARRHQLHEKDLYTCPVMVPYAHRISQAKFFLTGMSYSGTLVGKLLKRDPGDARGGALVGLAYDNAMFGDSVDGTWTAYKISLTADDIGLAPAMRQYMLFFSATDPADRVDEPLLALEVIKGS